MLNVELVERVVARYQDDHRLAFCAPPYATSLLPEAHGAAGVAGDHRHVERTDVDPQLERVGRDHASQLTAAQTRLDLGALVGAIAGFVCADPPGQLRTQQALHVKQHALDRHAGPAEKDAAVPSAQRLGKNGRRLEEDAFVFVGALVASEWRTPEEKPARAGAGGVAVDLDERRSDHLLGQFDRVGDRSRGGDERRAGTIAGRQTAQPPQHQRDVSPEHTPV